jgi:uncharacterized protein (DUF1330 family)
VRFQAQAHVHAASLQGMRYNAGVAIDPTAAELERFLQDDTGRPLVMVQLLRFTEGGRELYLQYSAAVQPLLLALGGTVLYGGECKQPLVAPEGGAWDAVAIIRYPNRAAYASLLADPAYQAAVNLRRKALREAMMLPMDDWPGR